MVPYPSPWASRGYTCGNLKACELMEVLCGHGTCNFTPMYNDCACPQNKLKLNISCSIVSRDRNYSKYCSYPPLGRKMGSAIFIHNENQSQYKPTRWGG